MSDKSDFAPEFIADPFELFKTWYQKAMESGIANAASFTLATIGLDGKPKARTLLHKGLKNKKFCFYTNYDSPKAHELEANSEATLLFYWRPPLDFQVRLEGNVSKMSPDESNEYFQSRPKGSRIAAIASPQSAKIPNRKFLDDKFLALQKEYESSSPKCPENWGGYFFSPHRFEFMILQAHRLHDRVEYVLENKTWQRQRLAP